MKPTVKLLIALPLSLLICICSSFAGFSQDCSRLRQNVIRLHILADSDAPADQANKLAVRDGLQQLFTEVFADCTDIETARRRAAECLPLFTSQAAVILGERGCTTAVSAQLEEEYFPATDYGELIMPPGTYTAVRIRIGRAQGKNWFCIAFPPLCVGASAELPDDAESALAYQDGVWYVTKKKNGYTVRFKLIQWLESLRKAFKNIDTNG